MFKLLIRMHTIGSAVALVLALSAGAGCNFAVPLAGKPCTRDADCASDADEPHYCSVADQVCLPGAPQAPPPNLPPIIQAAVIVAVAGDEVEARFTAVDPDALEPDAALTYALAGNGPSNGTLTVEPNGTYRFVAGNNIPSRRATFQVEVRDEAGGRTIATFTTVVIETEVGNLLTWTGAASSAFSDEANWSPNALPDASRSAFIPVTATAPQLVGPGAIGSVFIGPNVSFDLDGLVVSGSELFSASSEGAGDLVVASDVLAAGTFPSMTIDGQLEVDSALTVAEGLRFNDGGALVLHPGATLTVAGSVVQGEGARASAVAVETGEATADVAIDGDLLLQGSGLHLRAGRIFLGGNLDVRDSNADIAALVLRGKTPQSLSLLTARPVPSVTTLPESTVNVLRAMTISAGFDVAGGLSVAPGERVVVRGTLTLREGFASRGDAGGQVVAEACDIAPGVVVPDWVTCGVEVDAGPVEFDGGVDGGAKDAGIVDAGRPDAGFDAGLDAGPVDAGRVDAGPFDGGVDSGVLNAPLDAGHLDGGADGGENDAGPTDGGALDGGEPGGITCVGGNGLVQNGLVVLEAGRTRIQQLTINDGVSDAGVTFTAMSMQPASDDVSYFVTNDGALVVTAISGAPSGLFHVPVLVTDDEGVTSEDCATIRVVSSDEGARPVAPPGGNWKWNRDWESGSPPEPGETIFVPADVIEGEKFELEAVMGTVLVETGAAIELKWPEEEPVPVTDSLFVGGQVALTGGQTLIVTTTLTVASAARYPELTCIDGAGAVKMEANFHAGDVSFSNCTIDPNGFSLLVDDTATFASTTEGNLILDEPSSRVLAETVVLSVGTDGNPLQSGEVIARSALTVENNGTATVAALEGNTLRIDATTGPGDVSLQLEVGTVALTGQVLLNLDAAGSVDALDFGAGELCVSTLAPPPITTEDIILGPAATYAQGPAWTAQTCTGNAAECLVFEAGTTETACPFAP